jgi:hypothetical protein
MRIVVAVALAFALSAPAARASTILDQSFAAPAPTYGAAIVSVQSWAQTFTVGVSGLLSGVDLGLYATTGETDTLTLGLYATAGGIPTGPALYSTIVNPSILPSDSLVFSGATMFTFFDVSSANLAVSVGDVFAIRLSSGGSGTPPWTLWRANLSTDPYAGGVGLTSTNGGSTWAPPTGGSDLAFQTYVTTDTVPVPEPATLSLLGLGLAAAGVRRWRKR